MSFNTTFTVHKRLSQRLGLGEPFPAIKPVGSILLIALFFGVFVFAFLGWFRPYGLNQAPLELVIIVAAKYGLITFCVVFLNAFLKRAWIKDKQHWTLGKELLHSALSLFLIGVVNALFASTDIPSFSFKEIFLNLQFNTFALGIIPTVIHLYGEQMIRLRTAVKEINQDKKASFLVLKDLKGNMKKVFKEDIIMINSDDHYQKIIAEDDVFYMRETLKSFEKKINSPNFKRVHRSSMVNLDKIQAFLPCGNGEFRLTMTNDHTVKVSRSYGKDIRAYLNSL